MNGSNHLRNLYVDIQKRQKALVENFKLIASGILTDSYLIALVVESKLKY